MRHTGRSRQWPPMQQMHEIMWAAGDADEQAQRPDHARLTAMHKRMFEKMPESRKRIDAALAPQQREELRRGSRAAR